MTLLMVLTLLGVSAVAAKQVAIWQDNEYFLDLKLLGGEEIILPYGAEFEDPGAQCHFWGTRFLQDVQEVPVTVEGSVDTSTVGTYELFYSAAIDYQDLFWDQTQTRYLKRTIHVVDREMPVITLNHVEGHYTLPGQAYVEEGYTAFDGYDGDLTEQVKVTNDGTTVTYTVTDSAGNTVSIHRTIFYDDPIAPEITLLGEACFVMTEGEIYTEAGCTASDNLDGDITANILVDGVVDSNTPRTYTVTYTVSDAWGNTVNTQRTVVVNVKPTPPPTEPSTEPIPAPYVPDEPMPPNGRVIYLTFDDGPSRYTSYLLDVLEKYDVKATFFVLHSEYMHLLPRMVEEGHTVGMHCYSHNYDVVYSSDNAYMNDLKKIQDEVYEYTGQTSTIVRFPGGSSNTVSRSRCRGIMTRMTRKLEELGYRYFDWNVDSNDASGATTSYEVYCSVANDIAKSEWQSIVVLQHDNKNFSVNAVEDIIKWGLANGYTFAALDMNSPACELKVVN